MDKPKDALERMRKEWFGTQWSEVVKDSKAILAWADSVPEWPKELTRERLEELAANTYPQHGETNKALRALAAIAPAKRKRMVNLWQVGDECPIAKPTDWAPRVHELWRKVGGPFEIEE